ncbi:30S ribosomal protein S20 [Lactobacillus sp.]|uniref:30S ribosomal protein S20 n=1 Tax=Lactobacillus sp. TaxID=1591 RepID=UPI0019CC7497|nr:30S ribosomal protein S20 [Lactobacillus sp.]MBD5430086.1 30S ribosomal protein S20 [Lactobacillus sp.]MBD5430566.1 30S ribosomal protein S20 [Lactobacillus sp.]
MPQIKQAIKRVKTNAVANKRNASELSKLRTAVRKFNEAVEADAKDVLDLEVKAARALDKAASKHLISKNKANRDKSRMAKKTAAKKN